MQKLTVNFTSVELEIFIGAHNHQFFMTHEVYWKLLGSTQENLSNDCWPVEFYEYSKDGLMACINSLPTYFKLKMNEATHHTADN